jgi:hypothetical protein
VKKEGVKPPKRRFFVYLKAAASSIASDGKEVAVFIS